MIKPVFQLCHPGPNWHIRGGENFRSEERRPTSPRKAMAEWLALADAIVDLGGEVVVMPPPDTDPPLTGAIYAANHGAIFSNEGGTSFLAAKMSVAHREAETPHVMSFVAEALGLTVEAAEHVWEGQADIATLAPGHYVLTFGVRTVYEACAMVRARLEPGATVREVRLRAPYFHGDTCISALHPVPDRTLLLVCAESLVDDKPKDLALAPGVEVMTISEKDALAYACNALQVGDTLLSPKGVSDKLLHAIDDAGISIREMDFAELFGKGGGGPRCLVNVLRGFDAGRVPDAVRYTHEKARLEALLQTYPETGPDSGS
jgi:N-dimethylarginine dimethylaminohydrolase